MESRPVARWARVFLVAFVAAAAVSATADAAIRARGSASDTQAVEPPYTVYRPANLSRDRLVPLVVAFGGSLTEQASGFDSFADRYGFVVAYPDPSQLPPGPTEAATNAEQIKYVSNVIAEVTASQGVNPARVYLAGASGGGIGAYFMACSLSQQIAAIGSISGALLLRTAPTCKPSRAVSVIEIHGTADSFVPYNGDQFYLSSSASTAFWRNIDGCPAGAATSTQGPITISTWSPCKGGTAVTLVTIAGGGHSWPRNSQIDATEQLWSFFAAHAAVTSTATVALVQLGVTGTRGHFVLSIRLRLATAATLSADLRARGHSFGTGGFSLASGDRTVRLHVSRHAAPGTYRLVLTAKGSNGSSQTISRMVHIPKR